MITKDDASGKGVENDIVAWETGGKSAILKINISTIRISNNY